MHHTYWRWKDNWDTVKTVYVPGWVWVSFQTDILIISGLDDRKSILIWIKWIPHYRFPQIHNNFFMSIIKSRSHLYRLLLNWKTVACVLGCFELFGKSNTMRWPTRQRLQVKEPWDRWNKTKNYLYLKKWGRKHKIQITKCFTRGEKNSFS